MRNAFFLLLFGLVAFVGYSWWTDPDGFRKQVSEKLGAAGTAKKNTPAAKPDDAAVVVRELAAFASQNTEMILAPLAGIGLETAPATLADLKIRLNTELSKALVPAEKARLQAAMQLVGVMEQGILQRADHLKRRRAVEYREPPETGSRARVSPAEITAKMRQADFFVQGVDRKWADLAAQYRVAIGRLLASLSA